MTSIVTPPALIGQSLLFCAVIEGFVVVFFMVSVALFSCVESEKLQLMLHLSTKPVTSVKLKCLLLLI